MTDPGGESIAGLQQALSSGALTAVDLTGFYLARIERLNPVLHAVITVNPGARAEAGASDRARASGAPRGPLDGIPVLVKDNIGTRGMPTTAGSPALLGAEQADAFLVTRLRQAGAVIIGKANMSEWANFRSSHSTSGWSTLGGQAANPYALDRNPSGSSSGSAVAVAAGLAPVAVGTETDGSIVCPASACGLVGIKPTLGLVSRTGIVPVSAAQDTAGPMARTVADAAALLGVLSGQDQEDQATERDAPSGGSWGVAPPGQQSDADYTSYLDPGALAGARLGIWRDGSAPAGATTAAVLDTAVARLRELGAEVTDPVRLPAADKIGDPELAAFFHEFKHDLNAYLGALPGDHPGTLAELITFNAANADRVLRHFGQEAFEHAEATSGDLTDAEYVSARGEAGRLARTALDQPLIEHRLDAVVALTANPAWLTDYVLGDHDVFHTSSPAAVAGYPAITLPFGQISGLPVGITFMGPRWSEPRLIALAYALEQARPPLAPAAYRYVAR